MKDVRYMVRCQFAETAGNVDVLTTFDGQDVSAGFPLGLLHNKSLQSRLADSLKAATARFADFSGWFGAARWETRRPWPGISSIQGLSYAYADGLLVPLHYANGIPATSLPPFFQYRIRVNVDTAEVAVGIHCDKNPTGEFLDCMAAEDSTVGAVFRAEVLHFIETLRLSRDGQLITLAAQLEVK